MRYLQGYGFERDEEIIITNDRKYVKESIYNTSRLTIFILDGAYVVPVLTTMTTSSQDTSSIVITGAAFVESS